MGKRFEGQFHANDKTEIFFQEWKEEPENGYLIITHGLAEHSECYDHVARAVNEIGWTAYGWDLRGHGRSVGKRGFVADFSHYVSDLKLLLDKINNEKKTDAPVVLFGHSMGGLITLLAALELDQNSYHGLVLSSPALGYAIKVPILKDKIARIASHYLPSLTLYNEIQYEDLTHDSEMIEAYPKDTLRHDKISPNIYLGMLDGFDHVFNHHDKLSQPMLFQIAGHDKIVDSLKTKELYEKVSNSKKELHIYADSYHEIYNDFERETCLKDLKKFLGARS